MESEEPKVMKRKRSDDPAQLVPRLAAQLRSIKRRHAEACRRAQEKFEMDKAELLRDTPAPVIAALEALGVLAPGGAVLVEDAEGLQS